MNYDNYIKVGTVCQWIVGMPGPDVDLCVVSKILDTAYEVKFYVYGRGPVHTSIVKKRSSDGRSNIWPLSKKIVERFYSGTDHKMVELCLELSQELTGNPITVDDLISTLSDCVGGVA